MSRGDRFAEVSARLRVAGFVAAEDEAQELLDATHGDDAALEAFLARRVSGEPLAWILGTTRFCDTEVMIDSGVYVPRWQSEPLARRAVDRLGERGTLVDLCTGSGAIATVVQRARRNARIVATDLDERAVACARRNGVDALVGDLFEPLDESYVGAVDVVVAVVPYVPSSQLRLLPRDTLEYESTLSYDGGDDGTRVLRRVISQCPRFVRPGATLLLELGADQAEVVASDLEGHGFTLRDVLSDDDGDVRGVEATYSRSD